MTLQCYLSFLFPLTDGLERERDLIIELTQLGFGLHFSGKYGSHAISRTIFTELAIRNP